MRVLLVFILLSGSVSFSQEMGTIRMQKIKSEKLIEFNLPLKCQLFEKCEKKRFGRIEKVHATGIEFSYYDFDTCELNAIRKMDVKRREKDELFDTLVAHSKIRRQILFANIDKICILSGDANFGQQAVMLTSSVGLLGFSFALLQSTSTNVDGAFKTIDYFKILGITSCTTLMGIFIKRKLSMEKWQIVPEVPDS